MEMGEVKLQRVVGIHARPKEAVISELTELLLLANKGEITGHPPAIRPNWVCRHAGQGQMARLCGFPRSGYVRGADCYGRQKHI